VFVVLAFMLALGAALLAYGWFEAGWLRTRVREVRIDGLPPELDGLRVAHLSDFHLGGPGRGRVAVEAAVEWVAERRPELICVTGDLLSHSRGRPLLAALLERLQPFFVFGNHDVGVGRDPFVRSGDLSGLGGTLLRDEARTVLLRGRPVQLVGVDPRSYASRRARPGRLADSEAALRILLCHFPVVVRTLPPGAFQLVLAGHMHAGQIVIPYPGGKVRLAHLRARLAEGVYRFGETVLHVSPGLGTTFVPFRFFARPEVTDLVLRST
jgi:predicted MPP superfamily phosphohydrolase